MKLFSKLAAVAAVSALAVGGGASVASAYSISGGAYSSTPAAGHTFRIGGTFVIGCSSTVMSGSATGSDTTTFRRAVGGCSVLGFPWTVVHTADWSLKVTGGTAPNFTGELEIPAGSTMTWNSPIMGCTWEMAGPQTFQNGVGGNIVSMVNTGTGVNLTVVADSMTYTASGCPFSGGSNGVYNTNGVTAIPGITIS